MRKLFPVLMILAFMPVFSACDDGKEIKEFSKEGAIETTLDVNHLDATHDVIITTHNVWVRNQLVKKIVSKDTIPALGLTTQIAENNEGETKSVSMKKDYEIYITVK